jgi:hypothetical protein
MRLLGKVVAVAELAENYSGRNTATVREPRDRETFAVGSSYRRTFVNIEQFEKNYRTSIFTDC